MKKGVILILVSLLITVAVIGIYFYLNQGKNYFQIDLQKIQKGTPAPSPKNEIHTVKSRKNTTPNDTTNWIYFSSELYKYSLKYPNNYKIIVGNKNIFQANTRDYLEENGLVTQGAIVQVITVEKNSFETAWGNIEKTLENLDITLLSKDETTIDGEPAYKIRIENSDGTSEVRYLTYKSPYSYKIDILIGKNSQSMMDDYEQILDDVISTFSF